MVLAGILSLSLDRSCVRIVLGTRILGISYDFLRRVHRDCGRARQEPTRRTRPLLHFLPTSRALATTTDFGTHRNSENVGLPSA